MRRERITKTRALICGLSAVVTCADALDALGVPIGANEFIIADNARFPDVAYNSVDGKYLAVYMQYPAPVRINGRFVTADGVPSGSGFPISDAGTSTFFPAIAYNATNNEFLVTWDDMRGGDTTWGQRVRASDGALLGTNFQISAAGGVRSAVAWNATNNLYLVAYWAVTASEIKQRRLSNTGAFLESEVNLSNDAAFSGYPAVASDAASQFLVTWDYEVVDNVLSIRGQRVNAVTGAALGGQIIVSNSGNDGRSCIAFDPANSRWLVQFNQVNTGHSFDQYGQFVNTTGTLSGGNFPIAAETDFEGDTQFGGDVAFTPLGRYFSSFATVTGMAGVESLASGTPVTQRVMLGTGLSYFSLNNAADTNLDRFLTVWEGDTADPPGTLRIRGRVYEVADLVAPAPVTGLTASPGSRFIQLQWTNSATSDATGTMIRFKLGSAPTSPIDGTLLVNQAGASGSPGIHTHTGLTSGVTYHYAAFAHDAVPNYATAVTTSGVPATLGDFEPDGDVDQVDFAHLQLCFSGPAINYVSGCFDADFDGDNDVDGADLNAFVPCLAGADTTPGC